MILLSACTVWLGVQREDGTENRLRWMQSRCHWMVLRTAFHRVALHQTRDLECFADSSSIPWKPTIIFSSRTDCNSTADVPSSILRIALSAIPLVSDLCGVDVQWFQEHSSQDFQIPRNCQCKWLLVSSLAPRTSVSSFVKKSEVFVVHGYDCNHCVAKSCTTNSVSMIVSRFTSFTENFVIRSC